MSASITDEIMQVGDWQLDLDNVPSVKEALTDARGRPLKLHALFFNAEDELIAPPMVLLRLTPGDKGIVIGGCSPLWWLGAGDIGPWVEDREYVSGADKFDNGRFEHDDLYWRRPSEGSLWVLTGGVAANVGGLRSNDVLEYDREFPVRLTDEHRLQVSGLTASHRVRVRQIYRGRFNPPNRLVNGDFENTPEAWSTSGTVSIVSGQARSGTKCMRFAPIPKPELMTNGDFASGTADWTLGPTFLVAGSYGGVTFGSAALIATPNPQPQLVATPGLDPSAWTDVSEYPTDMDIVSDAGNAFSPSNVLRAGPVTQKQILLNSDFEAGFQNWYQSSNISEPDDVYYVDAGGGVEGTTAITSHPTELIAIRYLRSDSSDGTSGVQAYACVPGEEYELEVYLRCAPDTDGFAYASLVFPHPTLEPLHPRWNMSAQIEGTRNSTDQFNRITVRDTVPPGRTKVNVLLEVHNQVNGYYAWDNASLTRIRGNRARINYNTDLAILANTEYEVSAMVRADGDMQVGGVHLGVVLKGTGKPNQNAGEIDQGSTDYVWSRVAQRFRATDGYETAQPFVSAIDISGAPVYVDEIRVTQVENNTDVTTHGSFPVVPDQRYQLAADVACLGATRGELVVGVTMSGPGLATKDAEWTQGVIEDFTVKSIGGEVRPPTGYTTATVYVRSKDIEGGVFVIDNISLTKSDNNRAESLADDYIELTPERRYRFGVSVRSGANLQRGSMTLAMVCIRSWDGDFQTFESSAMGTTENTWTTLDFEFSPPSGYGRCLPVIRSMDIEGDNFYVDEAELRDTDTDTLVFDAIAFDPSNATVISDAGAVEGAESVRCQVIAERDTTNVSIRSVSFFRLDTTPATGNVIVADTLTDPDTSQPLSLVAGTVNAPLDIPQDWLIQNRHNREILDHLCEVIYDGGLSYIVRATDPPSLDVAPDPFTTHPRADAILPQDREVQDLSSPDIDVTDRPTTIQVVGAELQRVGGQPFLIQTTTSVPVDPEFDYNGRIVNRRKVVSDGTVDRRDYAQALGEDAALREAEPPLAVSVKLSGRNTRADVPPGDRIHVFHPPSQLDDRDSAPVTIEGRTVCPRQVTVLSRTRTLGPSHRVVMRQSDGSYVQFRQPDGSMGDNLPGVRWQEDSTTLTVGDRLLNWQSDPQGRSSGDEYLRDRRAKPR